MALSVQDHAQIEIFLNGNLVNVQRHIKDSPSTGLVLNGEIYIPLTDL